jgi:hypothetical protein
MAMRWSVKLEFTPDGGGPQVYELGSIDRSMNGVRPEEVGLTLEEGRELL